MRDDQPIVRVLGPLEIGGRTLRSRGARTVLAWLALNAGRSVRFLPSARTLWPTSPTAPALRRFQDAARDLGRQFPDVVGVSSTSAQLRRGVGPTDEQRFRVLVHAADPRSALELWRGRPYPDLAGVGPAQRVAEQLTELYLTALEAHYARAVAAGADYRTVAELRGALSRHPTRERLWRQLAVALFQSSRQAESLASIDQCRRTLARYGLRASARIDELYVAILRSDHGALAPGPGHVPI